MTAKPICLVYYRESFGSPDFLTVQSLLQDRWLDYHVLVTPSRDIIEVVHLQVFYEKDFTEIQYEELKSLIVNAVEQTKIKNHET